MAFYADDFYLDGLLDRLEDATSITVCAGAPTSIADIGVRSLASGSITGGDWTKGAGSPDGRENELGQQEDLSITDSGEADHVAIDDGTNFYVTECPAQQLTSGGTVTVASWAVTVRDPVEAA